MSEIPFGVTIPTIMDNDPPQRIIYREIDIEIATPEEVQQGKPPINIIYLDNNEPPEDDIQVFIARVINRATIRPVSLIDSTSPLDLNCNEQCYIVFQLADYWNWQFDPKGYAFTTKEYEGFKYFNLIHVIWDPVTQRPVEYPEGEAPGEGCRLLYFRAQGTTAGYQDGFNLTIELNLGFSDQDKRRTKIVVDPDIRHPGGST